MTSSKAWMRSSRVYRASGCQCQSRSSPGFVDSSILRHSEIWGAADEAVLKNVHKKNKKNRAQGEQRKLTQVIDNYWHEDSPFHNIEMLTHQFQMIFLTLLGLIETHIIYVKLANKPKWKVKSGLVHIWNLPVNRTVKKAFTARNLTARSGKLGIHSLKLRASWRKPISTKEILFFWDTLYVSLGNISKKGSTRNEKRPFWAKASNCRPTG